MIFSNTRVSYSDGGKCPNIYKNNNISCPLSGILFIDMPVGRSRLLSQSHFRMYFKSAVSKGKFVRLANINRK